MPTIFVRCMLFVSSYFPLTVIILILFAAQQPLFAWITFSIGLVGLIFTYIYISKIAPRTAPIQVKITGRQVKDGDVSHYIASYIIPLKNIATKPYLSKITIGHIKKVVNKYHLDLKIEGDEGQEKVIYDPGNKWVLLRLLDDDYLWSLLTEQSYEVSGKREL